MIPCFPHILVIDDDKDQRELLKLWLGRSGYTLTVVANGSEALAVFERDKFDAVLTDLVMPGINGLQLLTIFKTIDPNVQVIFLTGNGTLSDAVDALRQGRAFDFLLKPLRDLRQLNHSIEGAIAQRPGPSAQVPVALSERAQALSTWHAPEPPAVSLPLAAPPEPVALPDHVEALTRQEQNIMFLLEQGFDNRTIAAQLNYSEKTIRNYLSRVYEKLSVGNRLQAVAFCRRHGLILAAEIAQGALVAS